MAINYSKSTERKYLPRRPTALRPRLYVRPASGSRPHLKLPCVLPRPVIREVNMSSIRASYPELEGVAEDYVRKYLPSTSEQYAFLSITYIRVTDIVSIDFSMP